MSAAGDQKATPPPPPPERVIKNPMSKLWEGHTCRAEAASHAVAAAAAAAHCPYCALYLDVLRAWAEDHQAKKKNFTYECLLIRFANFTNEAAGELRFSRARLIEYETCNKMAMEASKAMADKLAAVQWISAHVLTRIYECLQSCSPIRLVSMHCKSKKLAKCRE